MNVIFLNKVIKVIKICRPVNNFKKTLFLVNNLSIWDTLYISTYFSTGILKSRLLATNLIIFLYIYMHVNGYFILSYNIIKLVENDRLVIVEIFFFFNLYKYYIISIIINIFGRSHHHHSRIQNVNFFKY